MTILCSFPTIRVIFPLNTSVGLFSLSVFFHSVLSLKFFQLFSLHNRKLFLWAVTHLSSLPQWKKNDIKTSCALFLKDSLVLWESLLYSGRCSSCTGLVLVLHQFLFLFYNLVCVPLPVSSTLIWSQSSAFSFVLDDECSWWTATAFCCG